MLSEPRRKISMGYESVRDTFEIDDLEDTLR